MNQHKRTAQFEVKLNFHMYEAMNKIKNNGKVMQHDAAVLALAVENKLLGL